jgi:hypothetical protein
VDVLSLQEVLDFALLIENTEAIDGIARQIHERYRRDFGAEPWEALSDWKKTFNRRSAAHLKIKLWFLGFELQEDLSLPRIELPEVSPPERSLLARLEHRRWMAEKLLDDFVPGVFPADAGGRTVYKDHLRIHQDIRPFGELTAEDVRKDEATFADLASMLDHLLTNQRMIRIE